MESENNVRRLWDMAAEIACQYSLAKIAAVYAPDESSNSNLNEANSPEKKKKKFDEQDMEREKLEAIKKDMDKYLIGPSNSKLRQEILFKFYEAQSSKATGLCNTVEEKQQKERDLRISLGVLECIMDDSCQHFHQTGGFVNHLFQELDPVELVTTIIERCPGLQELSLTIGSKENPVPFVVTFASLLQHLKGLKILSITWNHSDATPVTTYGFEYFFCKLGTILPQLISLEIGGTIPFRIQELAHLMFGNKEVVIPSNFKVNRICKKKNYEVAHITFTPESLSPICSQLTELKVHLNQGFTKLKYTKHVATLAFMLRNFPHLKRFPQPAKVLDPALKMLRDRQLQSLDTFKPETESWDIPELGTVQCTLNAPFVGKFVLYLITCLLHHY